MADVLDFDGVLKHYGVKGMKWGQRRAERANARGTTVVNKEGSPRSVTVTQKGRRGLKTSGGQNSKASSDAVSVAASRQKLKTSGIHTLSNKELQEVVNRMNLEQQYVRLSTPQGKKGNSAMDVLLKDGPAMAQQVIGVASQFKK